MRNFNILTRLMVSGTLAMAIVSCTEPEGNNSVVTGFAPVAVTIDAGTPAIVVSEADAGTYTFDFALDAETQVTDITLVIGSGAESTATEGEDFTIDTHEIDLAAFEGKDGFSVDVTVIEDYNAEAGDEDIYLTFTTTSPSGVETSTTKVITIEDSGLQKDLTFALTWELATPEIPVADGTEACDLDFDMTIQLPGGDLYDDDLLEYQAAGSHCPEGGRMFVSDMTEGVLYEIWVYAYGPEVNYGDFGWIDISIDFSRLDSDFVGTYSLSGAEETGFGTWIDGDGYGGVVGYIELNAGVLTLYDWDGNILGEGLRADKPMLKTYNVKKPG